nr:hypothetical protein [Kiritimatiellia bacterium]
MKHHCVLCLLVCTSLSLIPGRADSLAERISSDHLLYFESRDIPGYRERLAATPLGQALEELDWKKFVVQIFEIGRSNLENPNQNIDKQGPSPEELQRLLTRLETNWKDISSHFSGDMAFAMGNFESVVTTFQENKPKRAKLQQQDPFSESEEEETEAKVRLAREAQLDASELNSILSQFGVWVQVRNSTELETKLETMFSSLLQEQTIGGLELQQLDGEDPILYALTPALSENRIGLYWALHRDMWLMTLNEQTLRDHLANLA